MGIDIRKPSLIRQILNTGRPDGWALRAPYGNGGPGPLDELDDFMPTFDNSSLPSMYSAASYSSPFSALNNYAYTLNEGGPGWPSSGNNYTFGDNTYHTAVFPPAAPDNYYNTYQSTVTNIIAGGGGSGCVCSPYYAGGGLALDGTVFSVVAENTSIEVSENGIKAVVIS